MQDSVSYDLNQGQGRKTFRVKEFFHYQSLITFVVYNWTWQMITDS